MIFSVNVNTANAAFWGGDDADTYEPGPELARILRELADRIDGGMLGPDVPLRLRDANGNRVGFAVLAGEEGEA